MPLGWWFNLLVALLAGGLPARAAIDYLAAVKPVLTQHCVGCHGAEQQKGGLRVDTASAMLAGGDNGHPVTAGDASGSLLIQVIEGTHREIPRMPYKKPVLSKADIDRLRTWIDEGAHAPATEIPGRAAHWSFIPPVRSGPPPLTESGPDPVSAIDAFIRARLRAEGLKPSPRADRTTLLRRVSLDLTGLPPSPEEIDEFVKDDQPDAYRRVVERFLRSPHYGERWGRWWLDVARYADSNGYSIDAPRSMWLWRDWVVEAFNEDKPFDQFIVEQLAGDLLPDATVAQRIATGFHRNTQINQEGGIDPEQFRIESVIDRVNTTGTAFLGLTVACAQCHDHKFDPITQREYFQLFAFFNDQDEPSLPCPTPEQRQALQEHEKKLEALETRLEELQRASSPAHDAERSRLEADIKRLRRARPEVNTTLVLEEREEPRESYLFIKGDFTRRGPDVTPGTPAILHAFAPEGRSAEGAANSTAARRPNRLDLARWIVDPANPLTARVIVNRVWQQYFGRGLVETENDFGTQGTPPSHPELLDWLALELIANQWSLKAIHRAIVFSATYQQASTATAELAAADPHNRWLARQNRLRLDAELVRDVALAASGRLNPVVGGPPVFPPQPDGVMALGQVQRDWKASTDSNRFRRGLYTHYWRATPHPALAVFDAPDAFSACTRRLRSNTPLQALTLLNDEAFVELADALAERLAHEPSHGDGLELGFRLCVARKPDPAERERLAQLLAEERQDHGETEAWRTVARVLLNLDETITRE